MSRFDATSIVMTGKTGLSARVRQAGIAWLAIFAFVFLWTVGAASLGPAFPAPGPDAAIVNAQAQAMPATLVKSGDGLRRSDARLGTGPDFKLPEAEFAALLPGPSTARQIAGAIIHLSPHVWQRPEPRAPPAA